MLNRTNQFVLHFLDHITIEIFGNFQILNVKEILWDWNGTLIDDASLCVDILNQLLTAYGSNSITLNYYRNHFSFPIADFYKRISLPCTGLDFDELSIRFISEYRCRWTDCPLQPNTNNIIKNLSDQGIKQSILSAGNQKDVENFINHFFPDHFFDKIIGTNNIKAEGKVELGSKFFSNSNLDAHEILMIGDTLHDLEVGNEIGCRTLLYTKGHNSKAVLSRTHGQTIDDLMEVANYLHH